MKSYLPFYKRNLKVAIPVTLTQLGGGIVSVVDNIMVGHLGAYELGAAAFANSIFIMAFVFVTGAVMGLTPIVGEYFVKNDKQQIGVYLQNSLLFTVLLGVFVSILLIICYPLMDHMGQDPRVIELARPYFITQVISLIPFLFFCTFKQFLEGLGNTKVAMIITLAVNVVNIILNYLLIYGKFGFPSWGVFGAGVATLIARTLMPILFFIVLKRNAEWWKYFHEFSWNKFSKRITLKLTKMGVPIGMHFMLETGAFAISAVMVGWIGVIELAGNQVTMSVGHLAFQIVLAIGMATTIRVSHQKGLGDMYGLRMASRASVHLTLFVSSSVGAMLILLRNYIPYIYTSDPEVIAVTSHLLVFAGLFQISDGLQAVGAGILRGLSDVNTLMKNAFLSYFCINIPLAYVMAFVFDWGASGIWLGLIVGLSVAAYLFHRRCWKRISMLEGRE